ncbi:hypothetical protein [Caballeronia sp. BR00000012568055]|uniref:hypothetical protein n=1 Tax=Caballeronia sp. BR00000012568055 TaxID=2918761 RepID=UPI0023FA3E7C|nr:hypothetical protein [Caballeronia sp. BR00000012568055]
MTKHATNLQIIEAYEELTNKERAVLRRFARKHIRGTSFFEPDDLVNETLARALERSRKWPLSAPFSIFMCLAMRSVAEADRGRPDNKLAWADPLIEARAEVSDGQSWSLASPVEARLIALEKLRDAETAVRLARAALGDDAEAHRAIDGMLHGIPPRETCAAHSMSAAAFDAARQRATRRLKDAVAVVRGEVSDELGGKCGGIRKASRASSKPPIKTAAPRRRA